MARGAPRKPLAITVTLKRGGSGKNLKAQEKNAGKVDAIPAVLLFLHCD